MKYFSIIIILLMLVTSFGCEEQVVTVPVKPGESATINIPDFTNPGTYKFKLSIDKLNAGNTAWAPNIYFSLFQGTGADSFRLSLVKNHQSKNLIASADYYKDGKIVFSKGLIGEIPIKKSVPFSISWKPDGSIEYSAMGNKPMTVQTHLRDFNAKVHIASSTASFYPQ